MTKQEKIKEAYGEHWDFFKEYVNENGWIKDRNFWGAWPEGGSKINWETTDHDDEYYYTRRPLSLKGIEKNNGWIKIESEVDLPKEKGDYYVIDRFMETNPCMEFFDPENLVSLNERWLYRFSHYQPINKPEPPLY